VVSVLILASEGAVQDSVVTAEASAVCACCGSSEGGGRQTHLADEVRVIDVVEELREASIEALLISGGTEVASEVLVPHVGVQRLRIKRSLRTKFAKRMAAALVASRANHRARERVEMLCELS
jgi:hypothetical protein